MDSNYTCKYCGSTLTKHLSCDFCLIGFSPSEVSVGQLRLSQIPEEIPILENEEEVLNRGTIDLLHEKTLTLYYLLRIARKAKDIAFRQHDDNKVDHLVKKIYVIENLIFEREGVFPKSMQDSVLKRKRQEIIDFQEYLKDKDRFKMKNFQRKN